MQDSRSSLLFLITHDNELFSYYYCKYVCVKCTVLSIMQHKSPENNFDFHLNNISSEEETPIFLVPNTTTHVHILICTSIKRQVTRLC